MDRQPNSEPVDESVVSEPVGEGEVVAQENTGRPNMRGGGEWPDPDTPPSEGAPGA